MGIHWAYWKRCMTAEEAHDLAEKLRAAGKAVMWVPHNSSIWFYFVEVTKEKWVDRIEGVKWMLGEREEKPDTEKEYTTFMLMKNGCMMASTKGMQNPEVVYGNII